MVEKKTDKLTEESVREGMADYVFVLAGLITQELNSRWGRKAEAKVSEVEETSETAIKKRTFTYELTLDDVFVKPDRFWLTATRQKIATAYIRLSFSDLHPCQYLEIYAHLPPEQRPVLVAEKDFPLNDDIRTVLDAVDAVVDALADDFGYPLWLPKPAREDVASHHSVAIHCVA
jgi:hypothetical protein